jgi:hypothetical protein
VADGTIFEKRGIPAATIVTKPFVRAADAMAKRHDYPDFKYAMMPHPIGNLTQEQVRQRAEEILPQILAILGLD